ncbi:hypothetical protein FPHOBKDP_00082 [Listeria phage LPJP1]|nr:hypothetical protein FPHOBKDP_00082 [Listeria phage LPJP1]
MAEANETPSSLLNSSRYLSAIYDSDSELSESEKSNIIKGYNESNPYYKDLFNRYNIDYASARRAKDFYILKETSNTLDKWHKSLFNEAYYESINYFLNVTFTEAFSNQTYNREVYREYLIFMTIMRYINKTMEGYFNIDTYDRKKLKNGFISWGLDYFDSVPVNYQRRIYRFINEMISNKGDNDVFNVIKNLFSFDNVQINRYMLAKKNNLGGDDSLEFYKVPIDEELNFSLHPRVDYDAITEGDPYWRAEKKNILEQSFNIINTKYISVDIVLDLINNSKQLSYFYGLLNDLEIKNRAIINKYASDNNITYQEASKVVNLENIDFKFNNRNISDSEIHIFDAIVALITLVLKRMNWSDKIRKIPFLEHTYGYDIDKNVNDIIISLRKYLFWNKRKFRVREWENIMGYLNRFKLKGFDLDIDQDFDSIVAMYNSSIVYQNQMQFTSEYIQSINGSKKLENHIKNGNIYDGLEYLMNILLDKNRKISMSIISEYSLLKQLLSRFVNYQVDIKYISTDKIFQFGMDNVVIMSEMRDFINKLGINRLSTVFDIYNRNKTIENFRKVIDMIPSAIDEAISVNEYIYRKQLINYKNLSVFIDVFGSYDEIVNNKRRYTMNDFAKIYRYNEKLREDLEETIINTNDYKLYSLFNKLWNEKFTNDLNMDIFSKYNTFTDYLKDNDPNLYFYTEVDINIYDIDSLSKDDIYRERIFELVESIDNHLNLGEYDFLTQNNTIGLSDYVKSYIYILIKVFKSYTIDTVYSSSIYKFDSKMDNSIRLFDTMDVTKIGGILFRDYISIIDSHSLNLTKRLDDNITFSDKLFIKSND